MNDLLDKLGARFKITRCKAEFFVDLQIKRDRELKTLTLFQSAYATKLLSKFHHDNCKPVSVPADPSTKFVKPDAGNKIEYEFPYREAVGSLMYLMIGTRPDLAYIISVLSNSQRILIGVTGRVLKTFFIT